MDLDIKHITKQRLLFFLRHLSSCSIPHRVALVAWAAYLLSPYVFPALRPLYRRLNNVMCVQGMEQILLLFVSNRFKKISRTYFCLGMLNRINKELFWLLVIEQQSVTKGSWVNHAPSSVSRTNSYMTNDIEGFRFLSLFYVNKVIKVIPSRGDRTDSDREGHWVQTLVYNLRSASVKKKTSNQALRNCTLCKQLISDLLNMLLFYFKATL